MSATQWGTTTLAFGIGLALTSASWAQTIADPTRPPPGIVAADRVETAVRAPVLQSIIITAGSRAAVISGRRVELGGAYDGARLTRIDETEVVLRYPDRSDVLKMYPGVDIKPVATGRREARQPKRERN